MSVILNPWPWYVAGPLIGLMVPLLLWLGNKSFGISSTMRQICAATLPANIPFLKYDWKKEKWNLYFVAGLLIGGFIAQNFLHSPDPINIAEESKKVFSDYGFSGYSEMVPSEFLTLGFILSWKGLLMTLGGGFLVGFGSRYAGGCTSGHAITGLSNLQLPSLVSVIGFFAGGLLVTHFLLPFILG